MEKSFRCAAVLLALAGPVLAQFPAFSQSGSRGVFTLYNDTTNNVVLSFYTDDGSGFSENWMAEPLMPGQSAQAEFFATTGPCEQVFQVGWLAENGGEVLDDPISIYICEATNVYLGDNEISFD